MKCGAAAPSPIRFADGPPPPAKAGAEVTEGGRPAGQALGVKFLRWEDGAAVYEVSSGRYSFFVPRSN